MTDMRYMIHSTSFSQTSLELVTLFFFFKSILTEAGCLRKKGEKKLYHKFSRTILRGISYFLYFSFYSTYFIKGYFISSFYKFIYSRKRRQKYIQRFIQKVLLRYHYRDISELMFLEKREK